MDESRHCCWRGLYRSFQIVVLLMIFSPTWETDGRLVSMKIVEEPSSFGLNNGYQEQAHVEQIAMRVPPSNFSGPPHLRALQKRCFTKIDDAYKYEFCPFSNVTQHEQSLRWNPYSGVLGVWQEWEIENNTFKAMVMREGDACGLVYRTTKVVLKCSEQNEIDKVSEPSTCNYLMIFKTPYVCHPHSMLVYPTLSPELRHQWDLLEGQFVNEELTLQGHTKKLHKLFEKAGLMLPVVKREELAQQAKHLEKVAGNHEKGEFESLETCSQEYKKLKEELQGAHTLLQMYQSSNSTHGRKHRRRKMDSYDFDLDDQDY